MAGVYRHPPFTRAVLLGAVALFASSDGTALPAGVSAASAVGSPIGVPYGLPSGVAAASAENNPLGTPYGLPSGVSAASAKNNPIGVTVAIPSGVTSASAENNPIGAPASVPSGVSAASAENNPLGAVSALPSGQTAVANEHGPEGDDICFPFGQTAASAANNPIGVPSGLPAGVSAVASEHNPTATTSSGSVTGSGASTQSAQTGLGRLLWYSVLTHRTVSLGNTIKKLIESNEPLLPAIADIQGDGETVQAVQQANGQAVVGFVGDGGTVQSRPITEAFARILVPISGRGASAQEVGWCTAEAENVDVELEILAAILAAA